MCKRIDNSLLWVKLPNSRSELNESDFGINPKTARHGLSRPQVLFFTPRLRRSAKKLASTAAMFAAVGAVTLSCLVVVKVELAL
jgi:hypothetical protein